MAYIGYGKELGHCEIGLIALLKIDISRHSDQIGVTNAFV